MTQEQLAIKVLSKLGNFDRSAVDPADQKNVTDTYNSIYEILKDDGLVTWASTADIPDKHALPIVALVASRLREDYQVAPLAIDLLPIYKHPEYATLRRQLATPYVAAETEATYY